MKTTISLSIGQGITSALAVAAVTFGGMWLGLGWMSPSAHKAAVTKAVDAALVPVCAERFIAKPGALEAFTKTQSYNRQGVLNEHLPAVGAASMGWTFKNECIEAIAKLQTAAK